jgi:hypothetical protein
MRQLIIGLGLFAAQSAFAQTPRNLEACTQLRNEIMNHAFKPNTGRTSKDSLYVAQSFYTINRLTLHPCYLPPGATQNPACVQLREQTYKLINGLLGAMMREEEAISQALQLLELRRSNGDPCFLPPPPPRPAQPQQPPCGTAYTPCPFLPLPKGLPQLPPGRWS